MTRRTVWLVSIILPLAGCYAAPDAGYGYAPSAYSSSAYPPGVYPPNAYPSPGYSPDGFATPPYGAPPGYGYGDGPPTIVEGGVTVPLVLLGNEWGHYDERHQWHRAPEGFSRDMEERHGGEHFRPGGYPQTREGGFASHDGDRYRGQVNRAAQPAPGPSPYSVVVRPAPPAPMRQEEHQRGRECPPGQRC